MIVPFDRRQPFLMLLVGLALGSMIGIILLLLFGRREREERTGGGVVLPLPRPLGQPSSPPELKFGGGTRDRVDEASWESFPASDPPAW